MKQLHDLVVLRITQLDKEKERFPLVDIVGRVVKKWEPEYPIDKGWIDIFIPTQTGIAQPYVIEVETGYDFNCSKILQQHDRFKRALTTGVPHVGFAIYKEGESKPIYPKLCVVIPPEFAEFVPIFAAKEISVFVWEGEVEWKCKNCEKITLGFGPWKPKKCGSCNKKESSLYSVGLRSFKIKELYRVP